MLQKIRWSIFLRSRKGFLVMTRAILKRATANLIGESRSTKWMIVNWKCLNVSRQFSFVFKTHASLIIVLPWKSKECSFYFPTLSPFTFQLLCGFTRLSLLIYLYIYSRNWFSFLASEILCLVKTCLHFRRTKNCRYEKRNDKKIDNKLSKMNFLMI